MKIAKNKFAPPLHHLITGLFLMLKGYDKVQHHAFIGSVIFGSGAIILLYYLYIFLKNPKDHFLELVVHLFEGLALSFTACVFFRDGKTYIPYVASGAALIFFGLVVVHLFRKKIP